jgi:signal transduction histidine kinase
VPTNDPHRTGVAEDEMRDAGTTHRPGGGTLARASGGLPVAASAFVVVALLALAFAPVVRFREIDDMRARTAATSDRAQSIVTQLRLSFAEGVDYHEAFRLHQPGAADGYRQVRARESEWLDTLEAVTDLMGPRLSREVDSLRSFTVRWHALPDDFVAGRASTAQFGAALPAITSLHDSALASLQQVETSVALARRQDEARGRRARERQRLFSLGVGLLALLGTGVAFWFARRDRALSGQLARALEEEAVARAETERRRVELERVTESKSRLVRGFTHDVKNPIGAADGYMQLLEDGMMDPLTDRQAASVGRARRSVAQALRLIEDLLELARADSGELDVRREPVNLGDLARDATEEFRAQAEQKGLSISVDDADDGVVVDSDPVRVRQVLSNLVSNAVKYTDHGAVTVRVHADGQRGAIEVSDTGTGIPRDRQQLVFQEFVRLDPHAAPGAGVGLAISRRIVHALGGEITLQSESGRGSSFVLWLPVRARS